MSWFETISSLDNDDKKKGAVVGAVAVAAIGLLTAIVTHIDDLANTYKSVAGLLGPPPPANGDWLGIYREYDPATHGYRTATEYVGITARGDRISGSLTSQNPLRHHDFTGNLKDGFLILEYRSSDPNRAGVVVYVMQGDPTNGQLVGFWTGYDPEERVIMSCPYILIREPVWQRSQQSYKVYMERDCYRPPQ